MQEVNIYCIIFIKNNERSMKMSWKYATMFKGGKKSYYLWVLYNDKRFENYQMTPLHIAYIITKANGKEFILDCVPISPIVWLQ